MADAMRPTVKSDVGNWFTRHKLLVAGIIVLLVIIGIAGSSVSKPTVKTTPTKTSTKTSTSQSSSTTKSAKPADAHVGATISLKDQDGNSADVTLVKVVDPAQGADEFTSPDAGKRFVAVQFKITNTAKTTNDGFYPDNDVTLIDAQGQSYDTDLNQVSGCQSFAPGGTKLAAGESMLGCVTFQLPSNATVAKVKYTPSSGFADDTGAWLIP